MHIIGLQKSEIVCNNVEASSKGVESFWVDGQCLTHIMRRVCNHAVVEEGVYLFSEAVLPD
jgi:hypothetical protein